MTRSPCSDKQGLKKGPWTPEEDEKLVKYISTHGEGNWSTVPKKSGLLRCGKSCRLRWANYLRPDLKRGTFSDDEEQLILSLHKEIGNRWAKIALELPGRTDNDIKNYWNTRIKRKLRDMGIDPTTHLPVSPTSSGKLSAKASRRGPPPGESSRRLLRGSSSGGSGSASKASSDDSLPSPRRFMAARATRRSARASSYVSSAEDSEEEGEEEDDEDEDEEEEEKELDLGSELEEDDDREVSAGGGHNKAPRPEGAAPGPEFEEVVSRRGGDGGAAAEGAEARASPGGGAGARRAAKKARLEWDGRRCTPATKASMAALGDETDLSSEEDGGGGGGGGGGSGACSTDSERSEASSDAGSLDAPASPTSVIRSHKDGSGAAAAKAKHPGFRRRLSLKIPSLSAVAFDCEGEGAFYGSKEEAVVLVDSAGLGILTPTLLNSCPWGLDVESWESPDAPPGPASFSHLGLPSPASLISDLTAFDRPLASQPPKKEVKPERGGGGNEPREDDDFAWYHDEGLAAAVEAASGKDLFECDSLFQDDASTGGVSQAPAEAAPLPAPKAAAVQTSWADCSSNWSSLGSGLQEVYGLQEALFAQQQQQQQQQQLHQAAIAAQQQQQQQQQAAAAALCLPTLLDLFQSNLANPPPNHRWNLFAIQQQL